jgi:hypothetical protein
MMTMMCVDVQNVYKVKKGGAIGRKANAHHIGFDINIHHSYKHWW